MTKLATLIASTLACVLVSTNAFAGTKVFAFGGLGTYRHNTGVSTNYSGGVEKLCADLRKSGVGCTFYSYTDGDRALKAARKASADGDRIVIIGHSKGGQTGAQLANELAERKIKTDLFVALDTVPAPSLPSSTSHVLDIRSSTWFIGIHGGRKNEVHNFATSHTGLDDEKPVHRLISKWVPK